MDQTSKKVTNKKEANNEKANKMVTRKVVTNNEKAKTPELKLCYLLVILIFNPLKKLKYILFYFLSYLTLFTILLC